MAAALAVNWVLMSLLVRPEPRTDVSYTFFVEQADADNVQTITATGNAIQGVFDRPVSYTAGEGTATDVTTFATQRPAFAEDDLFRTLEDNGVEVNATPPDAPPPLWQQVLLGFGPTLLVVGLLLWFLRRSASGLSGGLGSFGRSRATRHQPETGPRTTFADVAGIDEVEHEVREIVDFLRDPQRYSRLGARIPRGVLLSGPPGTGKTLLARAVAGDAGVPFFSVSASEFIEAIVGVGASRVRDLFDQAKQVAPSIVFIDELDAIGRARGGSFSAGGVDEREQTLNQILTEMDGFEGNQGVVVLAATNRPEILDPALLRPGRFDRRVGISPPDRSGRLEILQVHTRHVPLAPDVDLAGLAAATPGMVGADLANLVNEAALAAARHHRDLVSAADFGEALEKTLLGSVRGIMLSPEEKLTTAYHESGHALLGMLTPGADPVRRVTIIPRGQALGVTVQTPQADRYGYTERYLRGRITGALGGRAAERIVYGEVTTGAESDLEQATQLARQMVGRWGMSPVVGPVTVLPRPGQEQPFGLDGVAPATRELVDEEVRRLVEECFGEAVETLRGNRERLDRLAHTLLERETVDEDEAYAAAGVARDTAPAAVARGEVPGARRAPGLPPDAEAVAGTGQPLLSDR
ncbi:ATP-dependent zinc metalloprotease FtsH [Geodermatophilus sp. DSM 45219]|uniref:ATP-dependent zinc metalloprotease FtsH n=1 Tax=Geodermatophilus sp. DSM 45219 TaxID=1881103 RepID=UPI00089097B8|nr:ATP-dependent zinc metalloprotease FtsH [Geodermatophilus sp. DSM 45219]SDN85267.1 cell division protease FtsH [Geodermatophilus sp. DSM 45219]